MTPTTERERKTGSWVNADLTTLYVSAGAVRTGKRWSLMTRTIRKFLFWLLANVKLGKAAPWVLGLALKRRPRKVKK